MSIRGDLYRWMTHHVITHFRSKIKVVISISSIDDGFSPSFCESLTFQLVIKEINKSRESWGLYASPLMLTTLIIPFSEGGLIVHVSNQ